MKIGTVKEIKSQERRGGLTPFEVRAWGVDLMISSKGLYG